MAGDEETPQTGATLSKDRMEAFSDGVLAIAITLLVLDLAVRPPGSPLEQFFHEWPGYLGYVISFLTIGAAWLGHHALTNRMDRVDPIFLRLNLLFLLVVVLPFPTRLVVDALHQSTAGNVWPPSCTGSRCLGVRLLLFALVAYARGEHLQRPGVDTRTCGTTCTSSLLFRRLCDHDPPQPFFPHRSGRPLLRHRGIPIAPFRAVARALSTRPSE